MASKPSTYYLLTSIFLLYCLFVGFEILHSTGYVDATLKSSNPGCVCHGTVPVDSVIVWISGPDSVKLGHAALYTLFMKGGPAVAGGYNVAAGSGSLLAADTTSQVITGELTHTQPKSFQNDTVRWQFIYHAPVSGQLDTIFSVGNSVNLNGNPTGDQFNFGQNFLVHLIDTAAGVESEAEEPRTLVLYQNYPNPFNPATDIRYRTSNIGLVNLQVFDVLGRVVTQLVNQKQPPGEYHVIWDGSNSPSGMYFYELRTDGRVFVKKMLLLK